MLMEWSVILLSSALQEAELGQRAERWWHVDFSNSISESADAWKS